ncbi:MAG: hypothetical protein ABEJ35_05435 [Halobacteriaceae archaeon]
MTKRDLVDCADVSRSTVDRGIKTLSEAEAVVRRDDGRYALTLFGSVVLREFQRSLSRLDNLASIRGLLIDVDTATDLSPDVFVEATIRPPEGMGISSALEVLRGAANLRLVDPPFGLVYMLLAGGSELLPDAEATALIRETMVPEVVSLDSVLDDGAGDGALTLQQTETTLPFSVALADYEAETKLYLMLTDREGQVALVESENGEALDWGEDLYDRLAPSAAPVSAVQD